MGGQQPEADGSRDRFYFNCGGLGCDQQPCICPKGETRLTYKVARVLSAPAGFFSRRSIFWPARAAYWITHFEWWWREGRIIRRSGRIPF
jgi:hypothetical protein